MKTNNNKIKNSLKIIIPLVIIIALFAGAVTVGIITFEPPQQSSDTEITVTVILDFGDGKISSFNVTTKNATVYGCLIESANMGDFIINDEYNEQFDAMEIKSIDSYTAGQDNKYWIYYLNGEYANVAADKQFVKNNDVIEWKYKGF